MKTKELVKDVIRETLLSTLKRGDKFTTSDMAHTTGLHFKTCLKHLKVLAKEGKVIDDSCGVHGQVHIWSIKK